jgi:hypothetical protein
MTEPKDLLLANEQLRRSNRFWKALALAACAVLVLGAMGSFLVASRAQIRAEHERRVAVEARARAEAAASALGAAKAAHPGPLR